MDKNSYIKFNDENSYYYLNVDTGKIKGRLDSGDRLLKILFVRRRKDKDENGYN